MPALRTRDTQSRSLEVTTDAPAPPSLAIISPTPRAFTFPITHNLSDSPYSSPSNSPFEPDRDPFSFHTAVPVHPSPPPFPPPHYVRAVSPDSLRSISPTPSHKRRKSSCSSDPVERRPKRGDEDYIKRPENAFILFRRKCCEDRQQAAEEASHMADGPMKKQRQADLSKTISQQWKSLTVEERQYWEGLAKEKKKEHEQLYPNYVYRPQRSKDKDGRSKNKKSKKGREDERDEPDSVSFVVPVGPRYHGRSNSAPTPPPYQAIKIPQVYHLTPSAPSSPSLLPMISRQSSQAMDGTLTNNFDFMPAPYMSFGQGGQLEASIQSVEFLRNMFTVPGQIRKPGPSPLQQLAMTQESLHHPSVPSLQIISPASSISSGSGSSGPSSPTGAPFTPSSAPLPQSFLAMPNPEFDFACQTQADIDLQAEMQLQNDFSQFTWDWPTGTPSTLDNNWDVNSIPSALLGEPKFGDDLCGTGLEFGQEFAQALDGSYSDTALLQSYDDLMAGTAFAA